MQEITTEARGECAKANFLRGCNCAQAVLLAFSDVTGLDDALAMRLASSFGGGMGRMREVCGTVSASLMVLGLAHGYDANAPTEREDKAAHYARVQTFAQRFRTVHGSIICREILANHVAGMKSTAPAEDAQITAMQSDAPTPTPRSAEYYRKRPCAEIAAEAARMLDRYLRALDGKETDPNNEDG